VSFVQHALNDTYKALQLSPGHYHAIHCRVRHPAHNNKDKCQSPADTEADKNEVLLFKGKTKPKALQTAIASRHLVFQLLPSVAHNPDFRLLKTR
jgi:hypothetical protein